MIYGPEYYKPKQPDLVNQLYPLGPIVVPGKRTEEIRVQLQNMYRPKYLYVTESRNEVRDLWIAMRVRNWAVWQREIAAGYFVVGDFESNRYQLDSHTGDMNDVISIYVRNAGSVARRFSGVLKGLEALE